MAERFIYEIISECPDIVFRHFVQSIIFSGDCWIWTAAHTSTGYACFYGEGGHRVSYALFNGGRPPKGYDIDHLCKVRNCVNPAHLEAVTHRENILRSRVAKPCKHGFRAKLFCTKCGPEYRAKKVAVARAERIQKRLASPTPCLWCGLPIPPVRRFKFCSNRCAVKTAQKNFTVRKKKILK